MRICLLAAASSIHAVKWVNGLVNNAHEVHLITMHPIEENKIDSRVRVHELTFKNGLGYYLNIYQLKLLLRNIKPDILNVHYASGYGTLGRLSNFKPLLLSVWGSDVYEFPYQKRLNLMIVRKNLESATRIASTSHDMRKQTLSLMKKTKSIDITPFGIDINQFKPIENIKHNDFLKIGIVKTLEETYGIKYLIEAMALLLEKLSNIDYKGKPPLLEIVGRGSQKEFLKQLCGNLNINHCVTFSDKIPNHEVPKKLSTFDVYCAPSLAESFGVAIIEASACEIPVVVTDVGGLKEVVVHGQTGLIVENSNAEAIANALLKLIIDEKLRERLGKNGRKYVLENYNWFNNLKTMEESYRACINEKSL